MSREIEQLRQSHMPDGTARAWAVTYHCGDEGEHKAAGATGLRKAGAVLHVLPQQAGVLLVQADRLFDLPRLTYNTPLTCGLQLQSLVCTHSQDLVATRLTPCVPLFLGLQTEASRPCLHCLDCLQNRLLYNWCSKFKVMAQVARNFYSPGRVTRALGSAPHPALRHQRINHVRSARLWSR